MMLKASSSGRLGTKCNSLLLSRTRTASAAFLTSSSPSSASSIRLLLSTVNGVVTTATTRAPDLFASSATIGAIPVPVPPPSPAVTKTRSAPSTILVITSLPASAHLLPIAGSPPAPSPLVMCRPTRSFCIARVLSRCCLSVFIATVIAPSTPMCVILFIVLFPEPPHPHTSIRGSGGPKFSNSLSVSAVGILAGALATPPEVPELLVISTITTPRASQAFLPITPPQSSLCLLNR